MMRRFYPTKIFPEFCAPSFKKWRAGMREPDSRNGHLASGSCEKKPMGEKTYLVVQGAVKICRPKSAGHFLRPMGSPEFREGTPANPR
jgi:hypothetical protein